MPPGRSSPRSSIVQPNPLRVGEATEGASAVGRERVTPQRPRPISAADKTVGFDSGQPRSLRRRPGTCHHISDFARSYVCTDSETNQVIGYYTLSAVAVEHVELLVALGGTLPTLCPRCCSVDLQSIARPKAQVWVASSFGTPSCRRSPLPTASVSASCWSTHFTRRPRTSTRLLCSPLAHRLAAPVPAAQRRSGIDRDVGRDETRQSVAMVTWGFRVPNEMTTLMFIGCSTHIASRSLPIAQ